MTFAQAWSQGKQLNINAPINQIDEERFPDAIVFTRDDSQQVFFNHEGIDIWCDQAFYYRDKNFVKLYGSVRMQQGDSIKMSSRYAEYNGDNKFAFASGNVIMDNTDTTLNTERLFFDRKSQEAFYRTKGIVRDSATTLESQRGRYFTQQKKYQFTEDVVITNPEYTITTDDLIYYEAVNDAYFYGPSVITGKNSKIYTERGKYNLELDRGYFVKNSRIDYDKRVVFGDSLYFDRNQNFASATNNIRVIDTSNQLFVRGHYAEVHRAKDSVFIEKRALAVTLEEADSVYVHARRITITGPDSLRVLNAEPKAALFKSDLRGKSERIVSDQATGITKMLDNPILWSEGGQIVGDTILLKNHPSTKHLDTLLVYNNAFMMKADSLSGGYNQIKGKTLYGLFNEDNEMYQVDIKKNAEMIIYLRETPESELYGIDQSQCGRIQMDLKDQAIQLVTKYDDVRGQVYPEEEFPQNARLMRGAVWRGDEEPQEVLDIFRDEGPITLTPITGLPLPDLNSRFFDDVSVPLERSELNPEDIQNQAGDRPQRNFKPDPDGE